MQGKLTNNHERFFVRFLKGKTAGHRQLWLGIQDKKEGFLGKVKGVAGENGMIQRGS